MLKRSPDAGLAMNLAIGLEVAGAVAAAPRNRTNRNPVFDRAGNTADTSFPLHGGTIRRAKEIQ